MRALFSAVVLCACPLPVSAQGWIDIDRPVGPVRASPAVVRVDSDVRVTVDGRVARVEVTERFRNTGRGIAEGTYHYPLPGDAVFSGFSLFQGEQELRGEMMSAEQARAIYEGIVQQLKDPALLTLVGHGLVRAEVFPIQPGETRTVILRYTQLLPRREDALRLRYVAGARGDAPVTLRVEVPDHAQFATVYSPTHPISERREGGRLRIDVAAPIRGDVELVLPFQRGLVGGTVLTHAQPGEDGFALLFLAPPPGDARVAVGRDMTFVVDVSGSMSGQKMTQARTALHQALDGLRGIDRFRLIAFSSGIRQFSDGWSAVTPATRAEAARYIDALEANGGTNLAGAVTAALAAESRAGRLSLVVLLTDGIPSVGEQAPDKIAADAAGRIGRSRIFTFGVGHDVNTYLLDRLAVEGRGSATYVAPGADVGDAVGGVLTKLSRPALVDLRIVSSPVRFLDAAPAVLPDLFFGEELVVLTRFRGTGTGPVVIEGTRDGRRERFEVRGTFTRHQPEDAYLPQLWAARRIGDLTRQLRLEGSTPEQVTAIRELGLRYGILTEYTSYLVQEPGMLANQPGPLPRPATTLVPRDQTGARAFEAAKSSANMSGSATLAEADAAVQHRSRELEAPTASGGGRSASQRVGGRMFVRRDGIWTDVRHRPDAPVTVITPYSSAYFTLIAARPALREALTVGTPLVIAGERSSLRIADGGISTWAPGALDRFLREFDGT
jgi:Ca-activated chloride channel family protein